MSTLAEFMIVASVENRPPMLDKIMYNSWQIRMLLYLKGKKNGKMMLESIENGPLVYPTIENNGTIRPKKYAELSEQEKLQDVAAKVNLWIEQVARWQGTELIHIKNVNVTQIDNFHPPPSIPQNACHSPPISQQLLVEFPQIESGLVVRVFLPGDDPITCLNKAMAFMSTGNATSSEGNNTAGKARVVKCYNCQGEGHMERQCTQPTRPRNSTWFKEKMMMVQAHEAGQELDEEQLAFLVDLGILDGQVIQTTIPQNAAFQTDDLDAYDSDCDDFSFC
ncbi:retrovirus-related pol polyprotein from transposon TNT 1-94 [Tanacetum coccineum]|uniref:Retrovirus-related pol polyprotein from transposon TNT 1-94 n=1 Tax=Tanacetum coccineum TaxID=301880 RepID=A0ABQ5B6A1_9ASTR